MSHLFYWLSFTGTSSPIPPSTCEVSDTLLIAPFQSQGQNFNFRGICEHVLVTACGGQDQPEFVVTVDFLSSNLDMGRVGIRIGEKRIVILEDLSLQLTNLGDPISVALDVTRYPDGIVITRKNNKNTIDLTGFGLQVSRRMDDQNILVVNATRLQTDVCGLCGTVEGSLLYGDRRRVARIGNRSEIQQFADSWRVNPREQFLREERRECSKWNMYNIWSMVYMLKIIRISTQLWLLKVQFLLAVFTICKNCYLDTFI